VAQTAGGDLGLGSIPHDDGRAAADEVDLEP